MNALRTGSYLLCMSQIAIFPRLLIYVCTYISLPHDKIKSHYQLKLLSMRNAELPGTKQLGEFVPLFINELLAYICE